MGFQYTPTNCCFCISLKTGSLIILWLYLISGLLWMLSPNIEGGYVKKDPPAEITAIKNQLGPQVVTYTAETSLFAFGSKILEYFSFPYSNTGWIVAIIGSINVVVAVFGLYGLYKSNSSYLQLYLIWELIDLLGVLLCLIYFLVFATINIGALLYLAISGYFWMVVFSYYKLSDPIAAMRMDIHRSTTA